MRPQQQLSSFAGRLEGFLAALDNDVSKLAGLADRHLGIYGVENATSYEPNGLSSEQEAAVDGPRTEIRNGALAYALQYSSAAAGDGPLRTPGEVALVASTFENYLLSGVEPPSVERIVPPEERAARRAGM